MILTYKAKALGVEHEGLYLHWWRGLDLTQRPPGYESDELPLLYPASNTHFTLTPEKLRFSRGPKI
jgi:hypothetical protein